MSHLVSGFYLTHSPLYLTLPYPSSKLINKAKKYKAEPTNTNLSV